MKSRVERRESSVAPLFPSPSTGEGRRERSERGVRVTVRALLASIAAVNVLLATSGCTSRGMTVTSNPPGAEVSINRRVVGKTPIRVGFTHYGTYRLELRKDRFQTLVQEEPVNPPAYGYEPLAFVADNVVPARLNDEIYLHYVLKPQQERGGRAELLDRAELARAGTITHPKSGQQIVVALDRTRKEDGIAEADEIERVTVDKSSLVGPATVPNLELPPDPKAKDITAAKPAGPRIGKELGLVTDAPQDKRGSFATEEREKPAKKETEPRAFRNPKDEELIYVGPEEPKDAKDPKKADAKTEEVKPPAPAKEKAKK